VWIFFDNQERSKGKTPVSIKQYPMWFFELTAEGTHSQYELLSRSSFQVLGTVSARERFKEYLSGRISPVHYQKHENIR